jgi:hypothetical protein
MLAILRMQQKWLKHTRVGAGSALSPRTMLQLHPHSPAGHTIVLQAGRAVGTQLSPQLPGNRLSAVTQSTVEFSEVLLLVFAISPVLCHAHLLPTNPTATPSSASKPGAQQKSPLLLNQLSH